MVRKQTSVVKKTLLNGITLLFLHSGHSKMSLTNRYEFAHKNTKESKGTVRTETKDKNN
jgi:hypothetical protein